MPIATRTFRVFVSSTFEDLKAERDALQREVFPKLRKLCEEHGALFQAIDLRWGVRDEAALDQQTMEICLREIKRCQRTGVKPNFIVLLGARYGWEPLPPTIPTSEFEVLLSHIQSADVRTLAEQWYRLDENAVPPERCLQPRTGEFVTAAAWNSVEQTLRQTLAKAAREARLAEGELIKYEASATHQEILAGLGETEADRQHVFGFFRRPSGQTDARLDDLKAYLRTRLPGNVVEFDPGDIAKLCDAVFAHVREVIESEAKRFEDRPALDLEVEAHDRFAENRSRIFTGRRAVLETIADYIRGPERRPLVLYGESGAGKSAVMAKASQQCKGPGRVIRRFIGASPESTSGHALLTSLCRQIAPGETPVDYAQLENKFKERLSAATPEQALILFIDALDQLATSDPARDVTWLPPELPPYVKVIISTTADVQRLPAGLPVPLERMAQSEGGQALDELLKESGRTLLPWQRETVLAHFARCGLPLYLKLAAEESKLWKSFASQDQCTLGEGIAGVIDTLLDRLASNANHGPTLVGHGLGYLAAARYGLTENETLDVLTADDAIWNDFDQRKHHAVSERRLPVVVWSRLSLDLEPYLAERAAPGGTVITFYHRQLAEHVKQQFLAGVESRARHADLARYFAAKPPWLDQGRKVPDARRAVELVFQQRSAEQWSEAEATLLDSQFLMANCAAGLTMNLNEALRTDPRHVEAIYNLGLLRWRTGRITDAELVRDLQEAGAGAGDVARVAVMRARVLLESDDCEGAVSSLEALDAAVSNRQDVGAVLAEARRRLPNSRRCLRTFEGHGRGGVKQGEINGVLSVCLSTDDRFALSGSSDKTLKLWEVATGKCLRTFEGYTNIVNTACLSADGRFALSCSYGDYTRGERSDTLKVWDVSTGICLHTIHEPLMVLHGACLSADGRFMLSVCDRTLKLWEVSSGKCLRLFEGHRGRVRSLALSADGRWALSGSEDTSLRLWEVSSGKCLRIFEGQKGPVSKVALSADAGVALSDSCDPSLGVTSQLKVWDTKTEQCLRTLKGHAEMVFSVSLSRDGRFALSGSMDQTLKLWDVATGKCLRTLKGHTSRVNSVSLSADGRFALSGSSDTTLKLWEVAGNADFLPAPWERSRPVSSSAAASAPATYRQYLEAGKQARAHGDAVSALREFQEARRQPGFHQDPEVLEEYSRLYTFLRHSRFAEGWEADSFEAETYGVTLACLSADGQLALTVGIWQTAPQLWKVATGKRLRTFEGHTKSVSSAFLSADGQFVLSGSDDKTLKLWKAATGSCLRTFEGHMGPVSSVFLPIDGQFALSGSYDKTLKLWEVDTGKCLRTFEGHTSAVLSVCLSADARFALSGSADNMLRLWEVDTGKCLRTFEGHTESVSSVSLSVDGRFALSGGGDKTLKLWEVGAGKCLRTFLGHGGRVNSACLSADGRFALSGSEDTTLKLWEVATGKCLRTFEGHTPGMYKYGVTSVCLSADGRLALSSGDKVLKLWFLDWELEANQPADWSEEARPYLYLFLSAHAPYVGRLLEDSEPSGREITPTLTREGKPTWSEEDFQQFLYWLGCAGYGWLRPEGVRRELDRMAAQWQGAPPMT